MRINRETYNTWLGNMSCVDHGFITEQDRGQLVQRICFTRSDGEKAVFEQRRTGVDKFGEIEYGELIVIRHGP